MPVVFNEIQVQDHLREIPVVIVTVMVMFILLVLFGAWFLMRYQRKKYQFQQNLLQIQKENEAALLQSQLEIQEQTFNAISQEIHDNVGQVLSLAKVQLNIAQSQLEDPQGILASTKENVGRAIADLRDVAKSLSSDRLSQMDLVQAIMQESERINKTKFISCTTHLTGEPHHIGTGKKLIIFRMVQEIINNALKHSGAKHLATSICYNSDSLRIDITDDGRGFNEADKQEGLGLQNIIRRAELIGGQAIIESSKNKGTSIQLIIPYE